jgi:hypothetical protein
MALAAQAIPIDEPYLADSRELIDVPAPLPGVCTMGGVARTDGQGLENVALRPGVTPRASSVATILSYREKSNGPSFSFWQCGSSQNMS